MEPDQIQDPPPPGQGHGPAADQIPLAPVQAPQVHDGPQVHEALQTQEIITEISKYLNFRDLKTCRTLCSTWNQTIKGFREFRDKSKIKIREKWYREGVGINCDDTIQGKEIELFYFNYRRHSGAFKNFFHGVTPNTTSLSITHCSMECDGLQFFLGHCPVLESLTLKKSNLRDLDDFHGDHARPRVGAVVANPHPITGPLRSLTFEAVDRVEQCFMDYLIQRTGQLETLAFIKSFHESAVPRNGVQHLEAVARQNRYAEFQRNFLRLYLANVGTLRELILKSNFSQQTMLEAFATMVHPLTISSLIMEMTSSEEHFVQSIRFFQHLPQLTKLDLTLVTPIRGTTLINILNPVRHTLRDLKVQVSRNQPNALTLYLTEFTQLRSLKIVDGKTQRKRDIFRVLGGKRNLTRRFNNDALQRTLARVRSKVNQDFLNHLPGRIQHLALEKVITENPLILFNFENLRPETIHLMRNLTKFELRGPYIHSMRDIIPVILDEMTQLTSLALTYCGLDDTHVTGLNDQAVSDIRRCLTLALAVFNVNDPNNNLDPGDALAQQVAQAIRIQLPHRRRISDLPRLRNLDLSFNRGISDIAIFDSLRMPHLESLAVDSCARITDTGLEILGMYLPGLIELNLKNVRNVTQFGLCRVLEKCKRMKKLYTTQIIRNRNVGIFDLHPNYHDIVKVSVQAPIEGF